MTKGKKKDIDDLMCYYGAKAALGAFLKEPVASNVDNLFCPAREEAETHIFVEAISQRCSSD